MAEKQGMDRDATLVPGFKTACLLKDEDQPQTGNI